MKGYRRGKVQIRPGTPELAARRKRREEEAQMIAKFRAAMKQATVDQGHDGPAAILPVEEAKDATDGT